MYLGDFPLSGTVNFKFTTRNINSVPATFSGGSLTIYKDSGTTNTNSGVTLTTDLNGLTGFNNVNISLASNINFYSTGSDYHIVVLSGSVSGTSVVGELIECFSIRNRAVELLQTDGIETGYSLRDAIRLILAASAGKLSGAETTQIYIRDPNDTKNRISATVSASGNRTSVAYDLT